MQEEQIRRGGVELGLVVAHGEARPDTVDPGILDKIALKLFHHHEIDEEVGSNLRRQVLRIGFDDADQADGQVGDPAAAGLADLQTGREPQLVTAGAPLSAALLDIAAELFDGDPLLDAVLVLDLDQVGIFGALQLMLFDPRAARDGWHALGPQDRCLDVAVQAWALD